MMKALLFSFFILLGSSARAGLMIEPYVGYDFGQVKYKTKVAGAKEYTDSTSNAAFGARLGYKFMIPWIAVDYTTGSGTRTADSASSNPNQDYTKTSIAGVVGADLPIIGLRVFGGYGFNNEVKLKGVNAIKDSKFKGTYTKAGLGYEIIPFFAINAEYIMNKYTKYDDGTTETDMDTSFASYEYNTVMISLSVPISL